MIGDDKDGACAGAGAGAGVTDLKVDDGRRMGRTLDMRQINES